MSSGPTTEPQPQQAPHPGAQSMPQWDLKELVEPPAFKLRNWASLLGPGLLMAGAAIGGGEWLTGPLVSARFGGSMLWLATLSILGQVVYNLEISRYTLYCGEPIFTGKFRTLPGPHFWLVVYVLLDFGSIFPYLASSAATPLAAVILQRIPDANNSQTLTYLPLYGEFTDLHLLRWLGYGIFLLALVPLAFGGKVYNSLKAVMSFKVVVVFGFLLVLAIGYSQPATWIEIGTGFFKFGNLPVRRGEDTNGNGRLDPGEDWDGDGHLDVDEARDLNGDGILKADEYDDLDGDGTNDGDNVDNLFVSLWEGRGLPDINFSVIALLCAMVAISGQGGLSNTPVSNYTRDQGWGMGHHVGAIPSVVGGHHLQLSHVGAVFEVNEGSLARWRRWYRHLMRDQLLVWMPACFLGLALPSMLSVQFLPRGTVADLWTAAGMTAGQVETHVAGISGAAWGSFFWFMTLFCGFLVLGPSMAATADGVVRRWVDVFWTSSARLRTLDTHFIRKLYFRVLCGYAVFGLAMLMFVDPGQLLTIAGNIFNYALGFSCWHALYINLTLLPRELRPNWGIRIALVLAGAFFMTVAALTTYTKVLGM